jgi:hypothetical protein
MRNAGIHQATGFEAQRARRASCVRDVDQEKFGDRRRKPQHARAGVNTACEVTLRRDQPLGPIKIGATRTAANNANRQ